MAKKSTVKRTAEWKRRSKASKKGWDTRRKRELPAKISKAKQVIYNGRKALKKGDPNPRIQGKTKGKSGKQLQRQLDAALKELAKTRAELSRKIRGAEKKGAKAKAKVAETAKVAAANARAARAKARAAEAEAAVARAEAEAARVDAERARAEVKGKLSKGEAKERAKAKAQIREAIKAAKAEAKAAKVEAKAAEARAKTAKADAEADIADKDAEDFTPDGGWVDMLEPEYIRVLTHAIAVQPSRLRHHPEGPGIFMYLTVAAGAAVGQEPSLAAIETLREKMDKGERFSGLDAACRHVADIYDVDLREVYTLLFSP